MLRKEREKVIDVQEINDEIRTFYKAKETIELGNKIICNAKDTIGSTNEMIRKNNVIVERISSWYNLVVLLGKTVEMEAVDQTEDVLKIINEKMELTESLGVNSLSLSDYRDLEKIADIKEKLGLDCTVEIQMKKEWDDKFY
jgi:hypothetical protein